MDGLNLIMPENFAVEEAAEFRKKINDMMIEGKKRFILNFSNCTFIDSTGLGVLVGIYKRCKELNGSLELHAIHPRVMKVFELTRLDQVFEIK